MRVMDGWQSPRRGVVPTGPPPQVVDLTDLTGTFLDSINLVAGDNPLLVVATKADLLPEVWGPFSHCTGVQESVQRIGHYRFEMHFFLVRYVHFFLNYAIAVYVFYSFAQTFLTSLHDLAFAPKMRVAQMSNLHCVLCWPRTK